MFKLNQSGQFSWPIEVLIPTDGGKHDRQTFDGVFKRKTKEELAALTEREGMTDDAFVREVLIGWKGITDDGAEVPFSEEALGQVLAIPGVSAAIVSAYIGAVQGLRRKN